MAKTGIIKTIRQTLLNLFKQEREDSTKSSDVNDIKELKEIEGSLNVNLLPSDIAQDCNVYVKFWLEEMNSVNVTLLCDEVFKGMDYPHGYFFLRMYYDDLHCLSLWNIEDQSSGFKMVDVYKDGKYGYVVMQASQENVKSELTIPDNKDDKGRSPFWFGFVHEPDMEGWFQQRDTLTKPEIPTHAVSTKNYGHKFILNFSVAGEFNLDIYYYSGNGSEPKLVFSKDFCCK